MKFVFRSSSRTHSASNKFQNLQLFPAKGGKLVFLKELTAARTPAAQRGDGGAYRNKCTIYLLVCMFNNFGRLGMQGLSPGEICICMVGVQKCRL
jgi:hypothetical protein